LLGILLVELLLTRTLVEILRHALLEAGHTSGKTGLRSPGSFFLVSRKSSRSVGSKTAAHAATARQRAAERDEDGRCDQTLRTAHVRFSALRNRRKQRVQRFCARAQAGGVFAVIGNQVSHCRVAAVSLARHADSASNSRAV